MTVQIIQGDCRDVLKTIPEESANCIVTSPPYWGLRDYGVDGQIGLERSPNDYVDQMVSVFREARRVLRKDGTLWLNLGDTYSTRFFKGRNVQQTKHKKNSYTVNAAHRSIEFGCKPKDLIGIPWMVAFALRVDGWWLRRDIIWNKPNQMPESVRDRPTSSHEYVFLLTKSERYWYDHEAVRTKATSDSIARYKRGRSDTHKYADGGPGGQTICRTSDKQREHGRRHAGFNDRLDCMPREEHISEWANLRSVLTIATKPFSGAHFATFPPDLAETCIKAGCPKGGTVLDPFGGAGTTGLVADRLQRNAILIELNQSYADMSAKRIECDGPLFSNKVK